MEINKQISKENSELCFEFDKIPLNILRGCWIWKPVRGETATAPSPQIHPVARQSMYSQQTYISI